MNLGVNDFRERNQVFNLVVIYRGGCFLLVVLLLRSFIYLLRSLIVVLKFLAGKFLAGARDQSGPRLSCSSFRGQCGCPPHTPARHFSQGRAQSGITMALLCLLPAVASTSACLNGPLVKKVPGARLQGRGCGKVSCSLGGLMVEHVCLVIDWWSDGHSKPQPHFALLPPEP